MRDIINDLLVSAHYDKHTMKVHIRLYDRETDAVYTFNYEEVPIQSITSSYALCAYYGNKAKRDLEKLWHV